jgi:diguanylate cyclase (GGDEF)-like protein/PAS domain S-box-containing protein
VIGFLLIQRGIRVFADRPPLLFLDFGLPPIAISLFYYFNYVEQNINIRIAVLSVAFMLTCSVMVITLLQEKNAPWRSAGFAVATVFGLFGASHGIRGAITLISPLESSFMSPSLLASIVFLVGIFLIGGGAITLILLSYAVLESELRIVTFAVNQSASSIVITDSTGLIEYVNPACIKKTGYLQEELIGENPRVLRSGETNPEEYAALWKTLSLGNAWRGEFHNRKKNGEHYWEIASIAPVKMKSGKVTHYVAIKEDITDLKHAEQRILHMANHDSLTGLPTRQLFMDRLESNLSIAKRNKTLVAVMFMDIDGFKMVNDTLGHEVGDNILKETATRLCSCVREVDSVARIGGDEFLVLLSSMPDKNSIIPVAEKLIKAVAKPYTFEGDEINIGASIGIALYPEHSDNPQKLINLADQTMYEIKRKEKNNYRFSEAIIPSKIT